MYTNIYQMKKDKYDEDKGTYISSVRQNNNYQEKLISYNDLNKNSNLNLPLKQEYINYEQLNSSSKEKELKNYTNNSNAIKKSLIIEDKNNGPILTPNNNMLQYNYLNANINNLYKSKLNFYGVSPKNYTFDSDSNVINYNDKNDIYFSNKLDILKMSEKEINDLNKIELSKSTSNFNTPYSFSSINLNSNKDINNVDINQELKNFNINNNYNNYYITRKNEVLKSGNESKTQTQVESKKEINIYKNFNKNETNKNSEIISKPKKNVYNNNINNNSININKIRNKSTKNIINNYNIYNINDFDNNKHKLEDYKDYYDNLINNDDEGKNNDEKTRNQFNINSNSYSSINKEYLCSINKKRNTYISNDYINKKDKMNTIPINNMKIYKNNINEIDDNDNDNQNKDNKNQNINNINGINFNNINIGINNNNFIIDNNLSNGYNTYSGSFISKPIKVNVNTSGNFNNNEMIEIKDIKKENRDLLNDKNIIKNKKYINRRNKSQTSNLIIKTEEEPNLSLKRNKSKSIYTNINKNNILNDKDLYNYNLEEKKKNFGISSYNYVDSKSNLSSKNNNNNISSNNFSQTTYIKKSSKNNIGKNNEYFIYRDKLNNLNEEISLKRKKLNNLIDENYNFNYNSNTNSIIKNKKNMNNNQIYISKNNYIKSERIINKSKINDSDYKKNNYEYQNKLDNIKSRMVKVLDIYSILLENKISIIEKENTSRKDNN